MKLWTILFLVIMVLCSTERGLALKCFGCGDVLSDPFCHNPRKDTCYGDNDICYEIHIKNIGISKGCTEKLPPSGEKKYCDRYMATLQPIISICRMCDSEDLCNNILNGANGTKLFNSLLLVIGVLIGIGGVRLFT